jgi:hypothetical protein
VQRFSDSIAFAASRNSPHSSHQRDAAAATHDQLVSCVQLQHVPMHMPERVRMQRCCRACCERRRRRGARRPRRLLDPRARHVVRHASPRLICPHYHLPLPPCNVLLALPPLRYSPHRRTAPLALRPRLLALPPSFLIQSCSIHLLLIDRRHEQGYSTSIVRESDAAVRVACEAMGDGGQCECAAECGRLAAQDA